MTGKYWSGTRKIFAVISKTIAELQSNGASTKTKVQPLTNSNSVLTEDDIKGLLEPLMMSVDSLNEKLDKSNEFSLKGPDSIYKDISLFVKAILKCPICCDTTKDEVPHATACCNQIMCVDCSRELAVPEDTKCPMCKQKRGPLYSVLLSRMKDVIDKVNLIPNLPSPQGNN